MIAKLIKFPESMIADIQEHAESMREPGTGANFSAALRHLVRQALDVEATVAERVAKREIKRENARRRQPSALKRLTDRNVRDLGL